MFRALISRAAKAPAQSALALRAYSKAPVATVSVSEKNLAAINESIAKAQDFSKEFCSYTDNTVDRWNKANDIYYGKERDMINFPDTVPAEQPKMRYFLRDSWFQAFYEKTGVTGPYVFVAVPMLALMSKELLVINGEFGLAIIRCMAFYYVYTKYAPKLHAWLDSQSDELAEKTYYGPINKVKKSLEHTVAVVDESMNSNNMVPQIFESKKENLKLQQELTYRQRMSEVHRAVKQQLDYMVMHETVKRRAQQTHLTDWVMKRAREQITPQMEKDVLASCIANLKQIAANQRATA